MNENEPTIEADCLCEECEGCLDCCTDSDDMVYDDSMDGDHDSAMESCGWGTDEDYGYFGNE